jgi:hypothetical protein
VNFTTPEKVRAAAALVTMCRKQESWGGYAGGDAPGLSLTCTQWIYETEIAGFATDPCGTEVAPNETPT